MQARMKYCAYLQWPLVEHGALQRERLRYTGLALKLYIREAGAHK